MFSQSRACSWSAVSTFHTENACSCSMSDLSAVRVSKCRGPRVYVVRYSRMVLLPRACRCSAVNHLTLMHTDLRRQTLQEMPVNVRRQSLQLPWWPSADDHLSHRWCYSKIRKFFDRAINNTFLNIQEKLTCVKTIDSSKELQPSEK